MNGQSPRNTVSRLRTPAEDGGVLVEPPLAELDHMLAENRAIRAGWRYDVQGRSLTELVRQARGDLLRAALAYTRQYRDVPAVPDASATEFFLAGHQPELFHPGVWLKNFVLGGMARSRGAVAVNLLVDTDTLKTASLKVPGGTRETPRMESIPFDRAGATIAYEERKIADLAVFRGFGKRAVETIGSLAPNPMLEHFWPVACERASESGNLGLSLAQARHIVEGVWGLETLEVPQSQVCATNSFRWFIAHLLAHLPRFREEYNETVGCYRRKHGIRSAVHPFPDLAEKDGWLEAPFWIWTTADPRRRPLLAACRNGQVVVSDGESREIELPLTPDGDGAATVERLATLEAAGIKIRPRALTTTLWARLALSDLFVHGIGGAKYDEVTSRLFERFLGFRPPRLMVVSGTLLLPGAGTAVSHQRESDLRQRVWRLRHHPERFLDANSRTPHDDSSEASRLIAEKRRWIDTPQTAENARERCQAIRQANAALQPYVAEQHRKAVDQLRELDQTLEANRVLRWRELSFCLHPEDSLRRFLDRALCNPDVICSNVASMIG